MLRNRVVDKKIVKKKEEPKKKVAKTIKPEEQKKIVKKKEEPIYIPRPGPGEEEIEKLTKGCIIVGAKDFNHIMPGDRIKYRRSDNGFFRDGGFVWYAKTNKDDRRFFMVSSQKDIDMSSGVMKYPVFWDKIKTLWKQNPYEMDLVKVALDTRQKAIDQMKVITLKQQVLINDVILFLEKKHGEEFKKFRKDQIAARTSSHRSEQKPS